MNKQNTGDNAAAAAVSQSDENNGSGSAAAPAGSSSPSGAYIVRLPCGNPSVYLRKEELWPHVREFADRGVCHVSATLARLQQEGGEPCELYCIHGHYAGNISTNSRDSFTAYFDRVHQLC